MARIISNDNGADYVRRDVFDARMDRLEAVIGEKLTQFPSQIHTEILEVRSDVRVLEARLNGLETTVYWGFAIIAFILAFSAFVPSITEFIKGLRRPSVTMEDVERAIAAAIGQAPNLSTHS